MIKLRFIYFLSLISVCGAAQDITNQTQFFINPYVINPSYAGIEGRQALYLSYRKQWASIEDGPTISNLSYHTPTGIGLNLGFNVFNDTRGILNLTGAMLTAGYTIDLEQQRSIRFGLSIGGSWNGIDLDEVENLNDPALTDILANNSSLIGNAGFSVHLKSFHFGASLPQLFSPSYASDAAFNITKTDPFQSIIVHASNRFYFANDKHVFEPYAVYRINKGLPSQYEVAAVLHLNHVLWLGGSFKQDFGISALGGIKAHNFFLIGASYSLKNSGTNELNSPTYEIQLSYLFGKKKKNAHVYSFVNSTKEKIRKGTGKSASEQLAEKRRQDELARKQREQELAKQKREEEAAAALAKKKADEAAALAKKQADEAAALAKKQEEQAPTTQPQQTRPTQPVQQPTQQPAQQPATQQPTQQPATQPTQPTQQPTTQPVTQQPTTQPAQKPVEEPQATEPPLKPPVRHDGGPRLKSEMLTLDLPVYDTAHHEEQARISRLKEHADDPDAHHEESVNAHPNAERHEFVKRGSHRDELETGDYVIAGVFKSADNAEHFAEGLQNMGFDADYGHLSEKDLWYVYISFTNDINLARADRDKFRKMKIFRDSWLLTVHH